MASVTDRPRELVFPKQYSVKPSDFSKCFRFGDVVGKIFASKSVCSVKQKSSGLAALHEQECGVLSPRFTPTAIPAASEAEQFRRKQEALAGASILIALENIIPNLCCSSGQIDSSNCGL